MKSDDIMRMARAADLPPCHTTHPKALDRFAAIVAAAERERAAMICHAHRDWQDNPAEAIATAILGGD